MKSDLNKQTNNLRANANAEKIIFTRFDLDSRTAVFF